MARPMTVMPPTNVKNSPVRLWSFESASYPAYNITITHRNARPKTIDFFIRYGIYKIKLEDNAINKAKSGKKQYLITREV